ncbi:hypothetical protein GWO43_04445, partial [candidate division KSB1 bacterium]|nr:hypothetical protein [candidate division KSB1 bacterium]NIR71107.1 hypothetical protein [candidate division KSB1 bacterium]NIS23267.1 hypothetical protein [candidate division KSB1 bacterium]NIT70147.1 hypothetical protein [candidate division KSB1 bacterium]NIU23797.1 hypothetical protein [candidate division KSB1 bacterium]
MSQSQPMCSFRFKHDPHLRCPHPVEKNGKCIFHLGEPLEKFQEELRSYLERLKNDSAEIWDFRGFIFPEPVNWSGETFPKKIDFRGAVFKAEAKFTEAIFKADAFFRVSNFKAVADFEDSIFEAAHFLGSTF